RQQFVDLGLSDDEIEAVRAEVAGVALSDIDATGSTRAKPLRLRAASMSAYAGPIQTLGDAAAALVDGGGGPVNHPPTATPQAISTTVNTPVAITLTGTDPDGDPLTYAVVSPAAGSLSGNGSSLTYTPPTDQFGTDAF